MRRILVCLLGVALLHGATSVNAQRVGTLAEWKQRVFDPATVGLELFPGSQKNLKFTIDQIRLDETKAKMVVYIIEHDKMADAAEFYGKQLGQPVETTGVGTLGELRLVKAPAGDPRWAGLSVRVENAQWATGKGQVWVRYDPPATP